MRPTVRQRLHARLVPCADPGCDCSGCLLIPTTGRYAQISVGGRPKLAHRVAWELDNEPIPEGMDIDHVRDRGCRHKNCANVAHLEPVTRPVNIRRMDIANNGRRRTPPPDAPGLTPGGLSDEFLRGFTEWAGPEEWADLHPEDRASASALARGTPSRA